MELEIGMYVRTINGKIWIIKSQQAISGHKKDIINASYNIIDLIEVGDYVNGEKVIEIDNCKGAMRELYLEGQNPEKDCGIYFEEIKSIVTREQFESMEYKEIY